MGQIFNPSAPSSLMSILTQGNSINVQGSAPGGGGNACPGSIGSVSNGTMLNFLTGAASGAAFGNAISGSINRNMVRDSANGSFGWGEIGVFHPLALGGGGNSPNGPNTGGFTIQIYAGTADFFAAASNPGYFIGLTSTLGAPGAGQLSTVISDAMGLICDSTGAGFATNWAWVTRRGAGAAAVTNLAGPIAVAAGQLFALNFSCPANSDAVSMTIKQLTAAGTWTLVLPTVNLTGIGAAIGTRVGPLILGRNFVNSGNINDVQLARCIGLVDNNAAPAAF